MSRRSGRADLPHPALRRASQTGPTRTPDGVPFAGPYSTFRNRPAVKGVYRPCGQSPGSWLLPVRARSQAPSLRRHYPASAVLRACPPPLGGPACPSRASG